MNPSSALAYVWPWTLLRLRGRIKAFYTINSFRGVFVHKVCSHSCDNMSACQTILPCAWRRESLGVLVPPDLNPKGRNSQPKNQKDRAGTIIIKVTITTWKMWVKLKSSSSTEGSPEEGADECDDILQSQSLWFAGRLKSSTCSKRWWVHSAYFVQIFRIKTKLYLLKKYLVAINLS